MKVYTIQENKKNTKLINRINIIDQSTLFFLLVDFKLMIFRRHSSIFERKYIIFIYPFIEVHKKKTFFQDRNIKILYFADLSSVLRSK